MKWLHSQKDNCGEEADESIDPNNLSVHRKNVHSYSPKSHLPPLQGETARHSPFKRGLLQNVVMYLRFQFQYGRVPASVIV
jgi:hypothetical protein